MIYLELFFEFFKIGLFTFGGGFAMIPLVKDLVVTKGWLGVEEFTNLIGVCESTPGPIAINMATYVGSIQAGFFGSVCATIGVVLPSVIIIILIAAILKNLTTNIYFRSFIKGVKPIISALILSTGLILLAKCFGYENIHTISFKIVPIIVFAIIALVYFLSTKVLKKKVSSIQLIILSAILGIGISLIME
ncbi:MAG: chromate transporter [Bacilli bacterium]|nr:chromate transporter [Bacilli bacterium]